MEPLVAIPLAGYEQVFDTGEMKSAPLDQVELVGRIRPVTLAHEQVLPVLPALEGLVPWGGLKRGATVGISGRGGTLSLALALVARASAAGSWTACVGLPSLGLAAASGLGVDLGRLATIDVESPDTVGVLADLVGAFDVVLMREQRMRLADRRRLAARARERGTVLVQVGAGSEPDREVDLRFTVTRVEWQGLGVGHGHLRTRTVTVETSGRRDAARRRRADLWLPGADGTISLVQPPNPEPVCDRPTETVGDHTLVGSRS